MEGIRMPWIRASEGLEGGHTRPMTLSTSLLYPSCADFLFIIGFSYLSDLLLLVSHRTQEMSRSCPLTKINLFAIPSTPGRTGMLDGSRRARRPFPAPRLRHSTSGHPHRRSPIVFASFWGSHSMTSRLLQNIPRYPWVRRTATNCPTHSETL